MASSSPSTGLLPKTDVPQKRSRVAKANSTVAASSKLRRLRKVFHVERMVQKEKRAYLQLKRKNSRVASALGDVLAVEREAVIRNSCWHGPSPIRMNFSEKVVPCNLARI